MQLRRVRTAGAVLLCGACTMPVGAHAPAGTRAASEPASAATMAMAAVARAVLADVNRARHTRGLGALTEDAALNRAARGHSEELAARRTLDHNSTNPALRTMTMRIEAAGGTWTRAAENLASMSGDPAGVPAQTVRMWLASDGHRANMLAPAYTHTGVGVAVDRRGVWYVTQLYTLPRTGR